MPTFEITGPDGQTYEIGGPEGATPEQAFGILQSALGNAQPHDFNPSGEGAPFWERAAASFKSSPQGRLSFYATRYGPDNVRLRNGEVEYRKSGAAQFSRADPAGLDLGDIADFFGDVPEVVGQMIGARLGGSAGVAMGAPAGPGGMALAGGAGSVIGAGVGTAGGNVVKQAIGGMIPGEEPLDALQRTGEAVKAFGFGAAGQKVGAMLAEPVARLISSGRIPQALAAWLTRQAEGRGAAAGREAAAIEAAVPGVRFTQGQRYADPTLLKVEAGLDAAPFAGNLGREAYEANLNTLRAALDDQLTQLSSVAPDAQAMGEIVKKTRDKFADWAFKERATSAAKNFAEIDAITGHTPIIDPSNARQLLQRELAQITDDAGESMLPNTTKEIIEWLTRLDRPLSASDAQKYLRLFGNAGYSKGAKVFDSLHIGDEVKLMRNLHRALLADLDETAKQAGANTAAGQLSTALQKARSDYALASQNIEKLEKSVLQRVVGNVGEENYYKIGEKILALKGTDRQRILQAVRVMNPSDSKLIGRGILESVIERSMVASRGATTAERQFSIAQFNKHLPDAQTLEVLLGDPAAVQQVRTIAAGLRRLELRGFRGESPTAEKLMNWSAIAGLAGAVLHPALAAKVGAGIFSARQLSKHLMTAPGRAALEEVLRPTGRVTPPRAKAALSYLLADTMAGEPQ